MNPKHRYRVRPALPAALEGLDRLAENFLWTWRPRLRDVLSRVDPAAFRAVHENPVLLLATTSGDRLAELAADAAFVADLGAATAELDAYLGARTWWDERGAPGVRVGYFSMEFGLHECLPIYSGGLGVLAGDHLKSASDLGVPLVGVGIAFSQGYFRQAIEPSGWQAERYPPNDWHDLPVAPVLAGGERVRVTVELPGPHGQPARAVTLVAWKVAVGRRTLYLLDANVPENLAEERALTNTLYGGDRHHRIRQEILLGVGGMRLLEAIGERPTVIHMNEGHAAFLAVERIRAVVKEHGLDFSVARELCAAGAVFTTHTPVPAGNDTFRPELALPYLELLAKGLGITTDDLLRFGRVGGEGGSPDEFSMPVLALRLSDWANGVAKLHGREARRMWRVLWPGLAEREVPIGSVTNGVHHETWVSPEVRALLERHAGPDWASRGDAADGVRGAPDDAIWGAHAAAKARLAERVPGVRTDALVIGFARRFATYKRGALLLRDRERLARLLNDPSRPVQLVYSGKAHPQDMGGKELIKQILEAARAPELAGKVFFVPDYEMGIARALVSGVDVWLNTPRRPLEASGTSGMKAALNGVLNASILDGWWCEGFEGENGFALGAGEEYADEAQGDRVEAEALYRLLEQEIVPLWFARDEAGRPARWIERMRRSVASVVTRFSTRRMVEEYAEGYYLPAHRRVELLAARGRPEGAPESRPFAVARELARWKLGAINAWPRVTVEHVEAPTSGPRGAPLSVVATIALGPLEPKDVAVDLLLGKLVHEELPADPVIEPMGLVGAVGEGRWRFAAKVTPDGTGEMGFGVRVIPRSPLLAGPYAMRLSRWG